MSTKIFPMRRMKPPRLIIPVAKAEPGVDEAEIARRAKQVESRRALAELRARDLERRARALTEMETPPRPRYVLPEDWLDLVPTQVISHAWTSKVMRKFMRKNLQRQSIGKDPQRTRHLFNVAMREPSMRAFHEAWVNANRQMAKDCGIEVSDDEIIERSRETLASVLAATHDNYLDSMKQIDKEWQSDPHSFGQW